MARKFYNAFNRREDRRDDLQINRLLFFLLKSSMHGDIFSALGNGDMMRENKFQAGLIKDLKDRFKDCMVVKNDASYIQGIPDLIILYKNHWAALECKRSATASHQPNQDYYVEKMNGMSYASYISPENKEEVLNELERSFEA